MANRFLPWIDIYDSANNRVLTFSEFSSDLQRQEGFIAGTPASSSRVNSALKQANLVVCALMNVYLPNDSTYDLTSSVANLTTKLRSLICTNIRNGAGANSICSANSTATSGNCAVFGSGCSASSAYSFVAGLGNKSSNRQAAVMLGKYSAAASNILFAIGVGTSDTSRKNALTLQEVGTDRYRLYVNEVTCTGLVLGSNFDSNGYAKRAVADRVGDTIDTKYVSFYGGTPIPQNADLNNYKEEGNFYIHLTADAETVSNIPTKEAGMLKVFSGTGDNQLVDTEHMYIIQDYTSLTNKKWMRNFIKNGQSSAWSDWWQYAGEGSRATNADGATFLGGLSKSAFRGNGTNFTYLEHAVTYDAISSTLSIDSIFYEAHLYLTASSLDDEAKSLLPEEAEEAYLDVDVLDDSMIALARHVRQTFRPKGSNSTYVRHRMPGVVEWSDWEQLVLFSDLEFAKVKDAKFADQATKVFVTKFTTSDTYHITISNNIITFNTLSTSKKYNLKCFITFTNSNTKSRTCSVTVSTLSVGNAYDIGMGVSVDSTDSIVDERIFVYVKTQNSKYVLYLYTPDGGVPSIQKTLNSVVIYATELDT